MYGLTRGATTLIGVVVAGFLLWLATQILPDRDDEGEYWAALGLMAAAGLTMALSQLLGGWTKWGWPRVSGKVFLLAFLPALILGGWVLAAGEPGDSWFGRHVGSWSEDIGIGGVVDDLSSMISGDRVRDRARLRIHVRHDRAASPQGDTVATPVPAVTKEHVAATDREQVTTTDGVGDDRRVHIGNGSAPETPGTEPEPAPQKRGSRRGAEAALTPGRDHRAAGRGRYADHGRRPAPDQPWPRPHPRALRSPERGRARPPTAVLRLRQAIGDELARLLLSRAGRRPSAPGRARSSRLRPVRRAVLRRRCGCRGRSLRLATAARMNDVPLPTSTAIIPSQR